MVGFVKGSTAWKQCMVGMLANDIRRIHEEAPETDEFLKELVRDLGRILDFYMSDDKPVKPMEEAMTKAVFGEEQ